MPAAGSVAEDRHLEHAPAVRADRQDRAVGLLAFGAERRQHRLADRLVALEHAAQHLVEAAGAIAFGGADELVFEAEAVQERLQPLIHVVAVALGGAERVRDRGQRLLQMLRDHRGIGDVVGNCAQAVHVVGERDQPGRQIGQAGERLAHQRGAEHLGEGADVRQPGRAVAGLEQDEAFGRRRLLDPLEQPHRLDHRPSLARAQELTVVRHHSPEVTVGISALHLRQFGLACQRWSLEPTNAVVLGQR